MAVAACSTVRIAVTKPTYERPCSDRSDPEWPRESLLKRGAGHVGRFPWLSGAEIVYWGDIDTHGFAILDRLRAWLPATRSVLMDRDTLLTHRERWGTEDRPEQERIDWAGPSKGC